MDYKAAYGRLLALMTDCFGIDAAKKFDVRLRFHRKLNLKNPQSLADKVTYIELHDQSPLASTCSDKFAVREYVTERGYGDILIPLVGGVWNSIGDIDFDSLPDSYVIKATHGCRMNYIVPDNKSFDIKQCKKEIQEWLDTTYGTYSMEPHYYNIPHRIYAEKYLGNMFRLTDYKFHCFNGEPRFVLTVTDRREIKGRPMQVKLDLFDMNWFPIFEVVRSNQEIPGSGNVKKPENFVKMCKIAKDLSAGFKFVRIDLYELEGKVYFSEMTFSPACCVFPYFSEKFLVEQGKYLKI